MCNKALQFCGAIVPGGVAIAGGVHVVSVGKKKTFQTELHIVHIVFTTPRFTKKNTKEKKKRANLASKARRACCTQMFRYRHTPFSPQYHNKRTKRWGSPTRIRPLRKRTPFPLFLLFFFLSPLRDDNSRHRTT